MVRLPIAALLPLLLVAACAAPESFPQAAGTPAEPAARTHALVVSGSALIPGRAGSGVVLDGTRIVTNRHVVAPRGQVLPVSITLPDGARRKVAEVRISDRMDLAVLELDGPALPTPCWRAAAPAVGERQWLIGSPASGPTLTTGQVLETDVPDAKFGALYAVGTSVAPGYSGGAAVDGQGCVAGITTAASGEGTVARAWALASPQVLREIARLGGAAPAALSATSPRESVGR
ncbi:MAG: trypsin-like peptidase domain-containing protein [Acetobacteraceae bacterium]|nr:trypsin-like peptidase domain-containing protein [Acetobacteraceae bacterium]